LKHLPNKNNFAWSFKPTGFRKNIKVEFLDSIFQINMESVSLSIKEEIADGRSSLHPDIGVHEVMWCKLDPFSDYSFYCMLCHFTIFLQISEVSCQVFIKEEAEEAKHFVPGNFPLIKEELLSER
jgi:hypothetical protein